MRSPALALFVVSLAVALVACTAPPAIAPASRTPVAPPTPTGDIRTGSVPLDPTTIQLLQTEVDGGHEPWRLDPILVARAEGAPLGFAEDDRFDLQQQFANPSSGTNHAVVRVVHHGETYELQLIQPARRGTDGIWVINDVRRLD